MKCESLWSIVCDIKVLFRNFGRKFMRQKGVISKSDDYCRHTHIIINQGRINVFVN